MKQKVAQHVTHGGGFGYTPVCNRLLGLNFAENFASVQQVAMVYVLLHADNA